MQACKLLSDISIKSYGMYLAHILFLNFYYGLFKSISDAAYVTIPFDRRVYIYYGLHIRIFVILPAQKQVYHRIIYKTCHQ